MSDVALVWSIEPTDWPDFPFMVTPRWPDGTIAIEPHQYNYYLCQTIDEAHLALNAIWNYLEQYHHPRALA
jgi:hypothetical protein